MPVNAGIWFGSCPTTNFAKTVDFSQYTGRWYEIQRDQVAIFETFGSCVTATYTARSDGDIDVLNRQVYWPWNIIPINVNLKGRCNSATGKCYVDRPDTTEYPTDKTNY